MMNKATHTKVIDLPDNEWHNLLEGIDISEALDWACLLDGIDIFEMIWYKYFKL